MKIVYDNKLMSYLILFENLMNVKAKDAFIKDELVYFVVAKPELGKVIGVSGVKIKKLQDVLKKRVRIIPYTENLEEFVKDLIYPFEVEKIENKDGVIEIHSKYAKTKGLLIGRERRNLLNLKEIISRYFTIKDVKVL